MDTSEIPAPEQAPRNAQATSSLKRTVTVIATFALATVFALAGTPDAAAAPATQNQVEDARLVSVEDGYQGQGSIPDSFGIRGMVSRETTPSVAVV
jgi:hypothetical protein